MTTPRRTTSDPAELLLRISRTPAGLHITSPQLPNWLAVARGPVPIAQAINTALIQLDVDSYAARRGQPSDLAAWDAACEALAASGHQVLADDVVVVRNGAGAVRRSGRPAQVRGLARVATSDRPGGKFVPQHDPFAWTELPDGQWRAPGGGVYGPQTRQVQGMLRRRAEATAATACTQQTFDDVA